jgi:hypothetical protein
MSMGFLRPQMRKILWLAVAVAAAGVVGLLSVAHPDFAGESPSKGPVEIPPTVTSPATEGQPNEIPGAEISLPESQVADRFYSYLIGLVDANTCGVIDSRKLDEVLHDFKGKTSVPFEKIKEIQRQCVTGSSVRGVSMAFNGDLEAPIPYSILGYHPGTVRASQTVGFLEWYLPSDEIWVNAKESLELSDVFVFGIYNGWAVVDIDAWMDRLLGRFLDDTRITVIVLFKYKGEWHGLAGGYGRSGEGRSGIFNFHTNKILFPTPRELQALAPHYRNLVVRTKRVTAPLPPASQWKPLR